MHELGKGFSHKEDESKSPLLHSRSYDVQNFEHASSRREESLTGSRHLSCLQGITLLWSSLTRVICLRTAPQGVSCQTI
jgi:hypothetical protein